MGGIVMISRIISFHIKPGMLDEAVRLYNEEAMPLMTAQKGFKSILLITDRESNSGYSVIIFETKEDLDEYVRSGNGARAVGTLKNLFEGSPKVEVCEVNVKV